MEETVVDPPLRPTGRYERFNLVRNYLKFYNNVGVTARYHVPGSLVKRCRGIEALIYAALKEVLNFHPIMGVMVEDEGSNDSKWVRLKEIDLREVVKFVHADGKSNPDSWVQTAHRTRLDASPTIPLWRVVVATTESDHGGVPETADMQGSVCFSLGFFCHHAIGDGLSGGAFQLTFVDALNGLMDGNVHLDPENMRQPIIQVPRVELVPSLEEKVTFPLSLWFILKMVFKTFIYSPEDVQLWSGHLIEAAYPRPPISNLRSFSLSPATANKLLARCRQEKVTITALVTTLVARNLVNMYPTHSRFSGTVPFSLRRFTGHTARDMGCYVSNVEPHFSSELNPPRGYISLNAAMNDSSPYGKSFWDGVRACKKFVDDNSASLKDQNVGMLGFVKDLQTFFLAKLGTKRPVAFEASNIGVLDGGAGTAETDTVPDLRRAKFDNVLFSSALCTYGEAYSLNLATAKGGDMTVALSWITGVVSDEDAKSMSACMLEELTALSKLY